jgi:uroporphyrinogen-III decarboxylase
MSVWENALTAAEHREPDKVPVVLWIYSLVLKRYCGVSEYEYYQNVKLQLEAKIAFQRRFPEILNLYTFPEYTMLGVVPNAFGAQLQWMKDSPAWVKDYPIMTPEDVDRLVDAGVPEPREAEVPKTLLERYEYFFDWFPRDLRDEYGYVDGWVDPGPCVEGAALTMGYDKFLIWLRRHPDVIHKWLKLATDFLLKYCEAIENIVGRCRVLVVGDHTASMVGENLFKEFILPYLNKVFSRYGSALRIWHNEGSVNHMLSEVDKIVAEVWQFGPSDDPAICKARTHFCLMGNIHPPWFAEHSPDQVEKKCREIILKAGEGGGLWLSTGGGLAPGTPLRNIEAMVKATDKWGIYPLKKKR